MFHTKNKRDLNIYSYHITEEQAVGIYKATGEVPAGHILSIGISNNGDKIYHITPSRNINKEK